MQVFHLGLLRAYIAREVLFHFNGLMGNFNKNHVSTILNSLDV